MRVLLLGGTGEARALAERLVEAEVAVTSSLAGRVRRPRLPVGPVRIGGFGGVEGLAAALDDFDVVVDATHPFAAGISANAAAACRLTGTPVLRFERPPWPPRDSWHFADDHAGAAQLAAGLGRRPFLTVGRQRLADFVPSLAEHLTLVRVVDPPEIELPPPWTLLTSRGPYDPASEMELMRGHGVDVLVTKDSGGSLTEAKLAAAEQAGIPVVVVRRPPPVPGVPVVHELDDAVAWAYEVVSPT